MSISVDASVKTEKPENVKTIDRKDILLRAAFDMIRKAELSRGYVQSPLEIETFYDGTLCDGHCLKDDIACILDIDENEKPLKS